MWVEDSMRRELDSIPPPLVAVSSLAVGADQLLAREVLSRGGSIHAILPFADLEKTFAPEDLSAYQLLRAQASVEVLSTPGTDEDAYLAAGRRVVELSDLLFAVWDGLPARGRGGTADVVGYALAVGVPVVHINPIARTVQKRGGDRQSSRGR